MNKPADQDEARIEASKAPLMDHLIELRKRLVWSLVAFAIFFGVAFYFASDVFAFLMIPLAHEMHRPLIATGLTETFFTYVKVGMFGGLFLGFPFIAAQLWLFVAPGLYRQERRAFLPFLISSPFFFILGAAFTFYVMLPYGIKFFLSYQTPGIEFEGRVSEYLDFVMKLIIAFGLTFQMPVILGFLGRIGVLTSKQLIDAWRYAVVGIAGVTAVITPPDPFSMLSLLIPLVMLYGLSILTVVVFEKQRVAKDADKAPS